MGHTDWVCRSPKSPKKVGPDLHRWPFRGADDTSIICLADSLSDSRRDTPLHAQDQRLQNLESETTVEGKKDMTGFYANLMTKNLAMGQVSYR